MNEYVDITITEDGKIEAHVRGVKGPGCEGFAKWLQALGTTDESHRTPDYFGGSQQAERLRTSR